MAPTSSSHATRAAASDPDIRSTREPRPAEGLYVHIPFCVSVCPYCDFVVYAGSDARGPQNRIAALVRAVHQELELRSGAADGVTPLRSVYLGGGTPSLLSAGQVATLLEAVDEGLGIAPDAEITLEANPGADEIGDLAGFRAAGVNRLSVGAQSMADTELRRLGRRHRASDVRSAVQAARVAGFGSLSLDLLTDVPGQTLGSWRATLEAALALEPEHLSAYSLSLDDPDAEGLTAVDGDHLPVSRGARAWRQRARAEQSEERAADMELLTDQLAHAAGLQRYEIANLARPGHESRHNLLYWRRRPHLALGPGAHAFDGVLTRTWNAARLDGYIDALAAGTLPSGGSEVMSEADALAESAILGLRLREGIDAEMASGRELAGGIDWATERGLLEGVDGRVRLTQQGRLLADEVFSRLLPEAEKPRASSLAGR